MVQVPSRATKAPSGPQLGFVCCAQHFWKFSLWTPLRGGIAVKLTPIPPLPIYLTWVNSVTSGYKPPPVSCSSSALTGPTDAQVWMYHCVHPDKLSPVLSACRGPRLILTQQLPNQRTKFHSGVYVTAYHLYPLACWNVQKKRTEKNSRPFKKVSTLNKLKIARSLLCCFKVIKKTSVHQSC